MFISSITRNNFTCFDSESQELLKTTFKDIDKAQDINIVHPNTAARLKSRLTKSVNNIK